LMEKATKDESQVPSRLKDLLETGSKDSQAFHKAALCEVVFKQMDPDQKACLYNHALLNNPNSSEEDKESARKALQRRKDGGQNIDLPEEGSLQRIFYDIAVKGGFLDDKREQIVSAIKNKEKTSVLSDDHEVEQDEPNRAATKLQTAYRR
jgi:hypothetical protein